MVRWACVCLLLAGMVSMADADCEFFQKNCVFNTKCLYDNRKIALLPEKSRRRCAFCYFDGTEPVKLDAFFRHDLKFTDPLNKNCPQFTTGDSHLMIVYLEVCEEARDMVANNTNLRTIKHKIEAMRDGDWHKHTQSENCTFIKHEVDLPLFSTPEVLDFSSGIRVASTYVNTFDLLSRCGIGETARTAANVTEDRAFAQITRRNTGTRECNIVKTGMRDIVLDHITLNNTECVASATAGDETLQRGECPLRSFRPDSMELLRLSPSLNSVSPEEVELRYVKLSTYPKYRNACPGRALVSADQKNAKKYPPDPVNIDMMCLDWVEDTHAEISSNGTVAPELEDPNETPATLICPPEKPIQISNMCLNTSETSPGPVVDDDSLAWPFETAKVLDPIEDENGTMVNRTIVMKAKCPPGKTLNPNTKLTENPTCVPNEDVVNEYYPRNGPRPVPKCPFGHTPVDNPYLPDNPGDMYNRSADTTSAAGLDGMPFLCAPTKFNSIGSRAIDITLWDFEGRVFFGNNWPPLSTGKSFTVLVFGDKVSGNSSTTKLRDGEVFEDYFDNTTGQRIGVFLPDKRITLLDSSDFYDVAEDEFGCFDRKEVVCPDEDLTFETLAILAGLTVITAIHHHLTSSKEDVGCIITPEQKKKQ